MSLWRRTAALAVAAAVASALGGCAHTEHLPDIDGQALAPGIYAFDEVRPTADVVRPWSPAFGYPGLAEPVVERPQAARPAAFRKRRANAVDAGPAAATAWLWYRFYKDTFSRIDGNTCRFRPSCSTFALRAVSRYGLYGVAMAFGRLHKDHMDTRHYPMTHPPLLDDPVGNYAFWLRTPRLDDFASYADPAWAWYQQVRASRRIHLR